MPGKEEKVNVPLDPETKNRLQARADANGRAMGREAAQIIKAELGTLPQQEDTRP